MGGIDTLDELPDDGFPTLGVAVEIWLLQNEFRVLDGDTAGELFRLTPQQKKFLRHWYRLDKDGRFFYRGASMRMSRGTSKSPIAALLALCELLGPVRFGGWDLRHPSGRFPTVLWGKPQSMPLVQIAAVSKEQASNVYRNVAGWASPGTRLSGNYSLDVGRETLYSNGGKSAAGGKLHVVTSSAATIRGSRPNLVVADEVGEWTRGNGGWAFYDVLVDNAAKVAGSRVLALSNAWTADSGSIAEHLYDGYMAERGVDVKHPWLYWSREASPETDWSDEGSIRRALDYVYAECDWIDREEIMSTIMSPTKSVASSMREYGNLIVSDLSSWVSRQDWDSCVSDERLVDGDEVVLGLDPAMNEDNTALIACRVRDGLTQPLFTWEPSTQGSLDLEQLDDAISVAAERFQVLGVAADVHPLEGRVLVDYPKVFTNLLVDASSKGSIAFDMRAEKISFARAAELVADEVLNHDAKHTGDPWVNKQVANSQRKPTRYHISIGRGSRDKKIDACIAMVLARMMRRRVLESDSYKKRRGRSRVVVFR